MKQERQACDRREFFRKLHESARSHVNILHNELKGISMMQLDDLETLPEDVHRQMKPMVRPGTAMRLDEESVLYVRRKPDAEEEIVRRLSLPECFVYGRIDGEHTNEDIATALARDYDMTEEDAFRITRDFFVEVTQRMICQPATA